jgi:type IV fimbrial biogenesis protein FimT
VQSPFIRYVTFEKPTEWHGYCLKNCWRSQQIVWNENVKNQQFIKVEMERNAGFTLSEMMVVVAVLAIMAGVAIPSFMALLPGMRLNGAARQVMTDLMDARMNAVKNNNEFKVFFGSPSANQYQILDDDDGNGNVDTGEAITTRDIQTEYQDVTLSATADPIFKPRGTAPIGTTITVTNSSGSKIVSVATTGRVKIQ